MRAIADARRDTARFRGVFGLVSGVFRVLIGLCSASDRVANGG